MLFTLSSPISSVFYMGVDITASAQSFFSRNKVFDLIFKQGCSYLCSLEHPSDFLFLTGTPSTQHSYFNSDDDFSYFDYVADCHPEYGWGFTLIPYPETES